MSPPRTLQVDYRGKPIFVSESKWLWPLVELRNFLEGAVIPRDGLTLWDTVIGRAAALMIVSLGIRRVYAGILSHPGEDILRENGVHYEAETIVSRINCRSERLLAKRDDPSSAWSLVASRYPE